MIIVMKRGTARLTSTTPWPMSRRLGLKPVVIQGTERTVIAAVGEERIAELGSVESCPGVDEVLPILAPYKLASRELKPESSTITAGTLSVGNGTIGVIAGPCSVETEEQILACAEAVKAAGATGTTWRSVQATDQSLQFPGSQGSWPQNARRGSRANGAGDRDRSRFA